MKHKLKLAIILGIEFIAIAIVLILIFFSGKKQYTVVFDIDGGTLLSGNLEQRVTQGHSANPPSVVKEGHYLRGWSGNYREITHNVEITAIWEYETTPGIIYNEIEGATYTEISGSYEYLLGKVYIGAYHNDLKVLSINDGAFEGRNHITDIHLLDGILSIGKRAFANCAELVEIELPDTTIRIDEQAFFGCGKLKSITLPESLTELGAHAFEGCDALVEVRIPSTIKNIHTEAFKGCASLKNVIFYEVEEDKDIFAEEDEVNETPKPIVPYLTIAESAFANCQALETINLPETLLSIGTYAFSNCPSLKNVIIPKNTAMIGMQAFNMSTNTIYLRTEQAPSAWPADWFINATVRYGYTGEIVNPPAADSND